MVSPLLIVILDVLVLMALAATIYYARGLSKTLSVLRGGKGEFAARIKDLTGAIEQARTTIADLSHARAEVNMELADRIARAKALAKELHEVCGVGEALAARLEHAAVKPRYDSAPTASLSATAFTIRDPEFEMGKTKGPTSRAERDLLATLRRRTAAARKPHVH